ncbi:MAG: serine hydrolase domain-containing protein, partial [Bacteroidota bacterium]
IAVDSSTLFPLASLTKIYSAVLLMQAQENQQLNLNDPIKKYLPNLRVSDSIRLRHVLSHTSQGEVGEAFYYSYRFGWLTKALEAASGMSFDSLMQRQIFDQLDLQDTYLLEDSAQAASLNLAQPYFYEGEAQPGFVDYGYSASAGLTATLRDLARFDRALDGNELIKESSKKLMFSPFKKGLPYGYGIFSQEYAGKKLVWAYGQYDCYASLILKVPSEEITLMAVANNNLMSDPPRLINGYAPSSLFVLSFLKNYVFEIPDRPLWENPDSLGAAPSEFSEVYRDKIIAQALAASFMARFEDAELEKSKKLLSHLFAEFPDYKAYGTGALMHAMSFQKTVAFHKELGAFSHFDTQMEELGKHLLAQDPQNPYLHLYLGGLYDDQGKMVEARAQYQSIVEAQNFSPFWYIREAQNWLKEHPPEN